MNSRGLGPRRRTTAAAAVSVAALGLTSLATVAGTTSASAAPPAPCVTAYPQGSLTTGQQLSGLTTVRGTAPEGFTGTVEGVLTDGIAPGVDMILADLDSPALQRNGVWAGMSGSPVYADPARTQLVGAVSYTLNEGKTTLAGITPAADMMRLSAGEAASQVRLSRGLGNRLSSEGTATRSQVASGLRALPTPMAISGLSDRRFRQLAGWLDDHGPVTNAAGGGSTSAAAAGDVVPGGNVAASYGWGYVTAAATGTVTAVCGDDVLAFGHPLDYAGDSTYSLHPASAVAIVPGGTFAGFKVANLGDRVGSFTGDGLAGIRGTLGDLPPAYDVTATATYRGRTPVTGTTHVTVPGLVADAGFANAFAVNDRALDRTGAGSAKASWTITGKRRNGTPFSLSRSDVFTSSYDVASAGVSALAQQAYALLGNETEAVTITGITTSTELSDDATAWRIGRTYQRRSTGTWRRITAERPARVRAGRTTKIRVELFSRDADTRYVTVPVTAGRKSIGRVGKLTLQGGYSGEDEWYDSSELFWEEYGDEVLGGEIPETVPETIAALNKVQKNDTVASTFRVRGTKAKKGSISLGQVVSGSATVPVLVTRR